MAALTSFFQKWFLPFCTLFLLSLNSATATAGVTNELLTRELGYEAGLDKGARAQVGATQGGIGELFGYDFEAGFAAGAAGSLAGTALRDIGLAAGWSTETIEIIAQQGSSSLSQATAGLLGADPNFGRQIGENVWEYNHTKAITERAIEETNTKLKDVLEQVAELGKNSNLSEENAQEVVTAVQSAYTDYLRAVANADELNASWSENLTWLGTVFNSGSASEATLDIAAFATNLGNGLVPDQNYIDATQISVQRLSEALDSEIQILENTLVGLKATEYTATAAGTVLSLGQAGVAIASLKELAKQSGKKAVAYAITKELSQELAVAAASEAFAGTLQVLGAQAGLDDDTLQYLQAGAHAYSAYSLVKASNLTKQLDNLVEIPITNPNVPNSGASSALNKVKLEKQLASQEQLGQLSTGGGTVISQPAKQANRIADQTGRDPANIQKVSSDARTAADGQHIETHSFRDASDNTLIEPKTVIDPNGG